jgi:hypothetical protein
MTARPRQGFMALATIAALTLPASTPALAAANPTVATAQAKVTSTVAAQRASQPSANRPSANRQTTDWRRRVGVTLGLVLLMALLGYWTEGFGAFEWRHAQGRSGKPISR